MTPPLFLDCVALFGSVPRGDYDAQSDQDVLIVSDVHKARLDDQFVKAGYSPSVYSWRQLEDLARDGSLFIQHLKQESQILIDKRGQLQALLDDYRPKSDYSTRLADNKNLFEITNGVPTTNAAMSWAFDVLAVAFRNHAILHLAQRRIYEFSYIKLVSRIASEFGLSNSEIAILNELRLKKRQYRMHPNTAQVSLSSLQRTQALLEKLVQVDCLSLRLSPQDFVARLLAMPCKGAHWYHILRRYEGAYRAMGFTPAHDSSATKTKIEQLFSRPSPYCDNGADSIRWIQSQIHKLPLA